MNIESLIARCFPNASSSPVIAPLQGDASARRYYRATVNPSECGGISSLIAMELPQDITKSEEATGGVIPDRLPFLDVGDHLRAAGIRVPRTYLDATDEGGLLLEDLGDSRLVEAVTGADENTKRGWYESAAAVAADMHRTMFPVPKSSIVSTRRFDFELLRWELDHYREWGIEAHYGAALPTAVRADLDRAFDDFATELAALPLGFVHRDFQSRNLMVLGDTPAPEHLAVIDFQDALTGPRIYDLVALLNDSYADLDTTFKAHILEHYAALSNLDTAALKTEFHLVTVQRKLKDGGRFVFIDRVKHNPSFLPFVETSFDRVKAALAAVPGHAPLKYALAAADPRFR